ncbi:MAG: CHAT domain-containing protein, partial [Bacteroidales bacterium]|nr:CHAT domain-containing protein [Bacteroidales bacterium]
YLCPDGVYHQINLNTLQYPNCKYLYELKDIVILNSLGELLQEKQDYSNSKRALLVGNPNFSMDNESHNKLATNYTVSGPDAGSYSLSRDFKNKMLSALPGTKLEVEKIDSLLERSAWITQCLTGNQALEEAIKSIINPQVLHIATHGFFANNTFPNKSKGLEGFILTDQNQLLKAENPMLRSGLMLCGSQNTLAGEYDYSDQLEDGILTAYEAMNLTLDSTELVILSACETGAGEIMNGEGVYGLQRAFQIAGAKNIIMSLWKVDDNATQLLMRKFYEFWLAGSSKREAFKMAQDYLRTKTSYQHPYYWGSFIYLGMDRSFEKIPDKHSHLLWLLILVLPVGLLIYYKKYIRGNRKNQVLM